MAENDAVVDPTLLTRAIAYAARAHEGQVRKGSDIPYIVHPLEAVAVCATMTSDPVVLSAAVLHDVVEDTAATIGDIRSEFGDRVAQIVASESEGKRADRPAADTWEERKQEALGHLASTDDVDVLMVCLSDKLSNIRAMRRDLAEQGEALWSRFNQKDPAKHAWYYGNIARILRPRLGHTAAWQEFDALVRAVFGDAAAAEAAAR